LQPKTPKVLLDECIASDKFRFAVAKQTGVQHHWVAKKGILSQTIGDTVVVTWTSAAGRSLCVKAVADCTTSIDTCVSHTAARPEKIGEISTENENEFLSKIFNIQIIPNPAQDYIEVLSNRFIEQYLIFDNTGRLILESTEANIDIKSLEKGLYILKSINSDKEVKILKFIKI
jgi:hypothetical protein